MGRKCEKAVQVLLVSKLLHFVFFLNQPSNSPNCYASHNISVIPGVPTVFRIPNEIDMVTSGNSAFLSTDASKFLQVGYRIS